MCIFVLVNNQNQIIMREIEFKGVWLEVHYDVTPKAEGDYSTPGCPESYNLTKVTIKVVYVTTLVDDCLEERETKLNQTL